MRVAPLIAGCLLSSLACADAFVTPLVGGGGGSNYTRNCGASAVLVGVQTRAGAWLDQLTPVCRQLAANGTLGNDFTLTRIGGTGGNDIEQLSCASGKVLVGLIARWATYVNYVQLRCATWSAANKTRGSAATYGPELGSSSGGVTTTTLDCPSNQVAKALKGKAGSFVDSLSVVCNAWNQ